MISSKINSKKNNLNAGKFEIRYELVNILDKTRLDEKMSI